MYGIVNLQGRGGEVDFNKQDLLTCIKKLKPVLFNKIQFPLFNKNSSNSLTKSINILIPRFYLINHRLEVIRQYIK